MPQSHLTRAIEHHARFSANEIMLVCEEDRLSWSEFERLTRRLANAIISAGLGRGDRACVYMGNSAIGFVAMWGIIRAGGIVVALNTQLRGQALAQTANDAGAAMVFTDADLAAEFDGIWPQLTSLTRDRLFVKGGGAGSIEALIEAGGEDALPIINEEDSISIVYSSGSTGKPKGSEHSHGARQSFSLGLGGMLRIVDGHAVTLVTTPLCTNGTWITMAPTMYRGGRIVLASRFSAQGFIDLVETERCTHAFVVPTQCIAVVGHPGVETRDLSSISDLLCSGQPLMPATYEALLGLMPQARIYEAYGMSEGFCTLATPEDFARGKAGTVGKPAYLDDIAVLGPDGAVLPHGETGEIAGWSAGMMKGYHGDPAKTAESIWTDGTGRKLLRSGDLGHFDADGYLFISGRIKDMIKSGGLNVFASDIEAVFIAHTAVREVAAIGVPHPKWGETPVLLAILQDGAQVSEAELMEWGNGRLAKFQRVSAIEFRDEFARAQYGKINKPAMRAPYWEKQPA